MPPPVRPRRGAGPGATLRDLLDALGPAVVELVDAPAGEDAPLGSTTLVDGSDLVVAADSGSSLCLHIGVTNADAVRWFDETARLAPERRPRAVMSKAGLTSPAVRAAARKAGVALVAVHRQARWDHVLPLVQRVLDRSGQQAAEDPELLGTETDLFELARIVAQNARGLVSIEDAHSRVLAYSAANDAADELRTLSILGREGPPEYLRALREWGVFDRVRATDEVVDVPAHAELGTRRRLVVGIREPGERSPAVLGSLWLQQGTGPFSADAADVLRGASAIAARIISRARNAPSTEGLLIQRLFGARGGGVDVPSLAAALNLPVGGPAAVVGFAQTAPPGPGRGDRLAGLGSLLRLHASSFRRDAVATIIGDRAYLLLPGVSAAAPAAAWARRLVEEFEVRRSLVLRAAIAAPVADLGQVGAARAEVDRVLDGATATGGRVTTLAESRTAVLLGEILALVACHPEVHDPRLAALVDYDRDHGSALRESVETYLALHGDVRSAAAALRVHPNTLRYRVRRVEEITGLALADAADRLLLELQLAVLAGDRRPRTGGAVRG